MGIKVMSNGDAVDKISEYIVVAGRDIGVDDEALAQIAERAAEFMRRHFGGRAVCIAPYDRETRDEMIRRDFNGRNVREVMIRYDVSRATVYRIVNK